MDPEKRFSLSLLSRRFLRFRHHSHIAIITGRGEHASDTNVSSDILSDPHRLDVPPQHHFQVPSLMGSGTWPSKKFWHSIVYMITGYASNSTHPSRDISQDHNAPRNMHACVPVIFSVSRLAQMFLTNSSFVQSGCSKQKTLNDLGPGPDRGKGSTEQPVELQNSPHVYCL